jgi:DNA-binding CsgD family transcriptional regulator
VTGFPAKGGRFDRLSAPANSNKQTMLFGKQPTSAAVALATYSFGEDREHPTPEQAMDLVALSHTVIEHQLYSTMLAEISTVGTRVATFTTRRLMTLTGIAGYSTVRRGVAGLVNKLSIERQKVAGHNGNQPLLVYLVFTPEEILARRQAAGLSPYPKGVELPAGIRSLGRAGKRIVEMGCLSRREAQVAWCCAQGLTNAEIGKRLLVSEQTVKFHLRNIFVKFRVKRRAELVSRLFRDGSDTDFSL